MALQSDGLNQTTLAMSALFACLAKAMSEHGSIVLSDFQKNLEEAYNEVREGPDNIGAMEALKWTNEILKTIR